ncbi:MAG: hypothetical protein FWG93_05270, partial [Oscillospiraceae bacterium]|nr:hypothetical protein [Oscillospiraceae bacterium]
SSDWGFSDLMRASRAAVHLHLFYTDMAGLFAERLARIPVPFDLFVSVPEGREDAAAPFSALKHARRVTVRAVENRGRDVMPMIRVFGERLAEYDVFLHIHAKKSPHDGTLAGWLDHLLDNLLPDEGTVAAILGLFAGHPELGILYPEPPDAFPYWTLTTGSNRDEMVRLFTRLGLEFPEDDPYPDFPAGTMFWARGAALAALLRSRLDGFPEESGQVDGTLAHAVERSLCLIAARAGYQPAQIDAANGLASIGPGLKNLPEYIALRPEDAAQYLKGFKHAAFDLFGTLAVSDFPSERELWARVASLSSLEEFPRWRREAGDAAAETCGAPDIHTVYAELRRVSGLPASECRRLKALEFEELLESCRPRRAVVRLLEGLLERNADVVLAEDTLWPAAYIQRILEKCGVRGDLDIYVSGELGYSKKNGSLYDYLKGRFKGRPFVNAGDDDYRDAHIPNTRRIHALHLLHPDDMAAVIGLTGEEKALYRARMADDPFCLLDILRERAVTAAPAAPGGSAP